MNEDRKNAEEEYEEIKGCKSESRVQFAKEYLYACISAGKGESTAIELVKLFEEHNPELRRPTQTEIVELKRMWEVISDRYSKGNYFGARGSEEYVNGLFLALYTKETPDEKHERLNRTRAILKANSPGLSARIDAAYEQLQRAQGKRARMSREIYSQCERLTNSTGHMARELHGMVLQENQNARWAEQDHESAVARYSAVNGILYDWAERLTLEEARSTNLDEKLKVE